MSGFGFSTPCEEIVEIFASCVSGRTFLVTGTSANGLGAHAAIALARGSPASIILLSRNKSKVEPVINEIKQINPNIKVVFIQCELSDQTSVRQAADEILKDGDLPKIDVIINNAGIMNVKDFTLDKQGIELTFSANHIGHFLLTNLLLPKVIASGPGARIVNMSSAGHRISPVLLEDHNFSGGKTYNGWTAYGQSKSANMLFSVSLTEGLAKKGITSFSVHPGVIFSTSLCSHLETDDFTDLPSIAKRNTGRNFPGWVVKTASQATSPMLAAALDPALEEHSGAYIDDCQVGDPYEYAVDAENAKKLWSLSERLVGQKFDLENVG